MKKNYMKPETTVLDIVANRCILQTSSISIVDEEYNDEFDVKEEDLFGNENFGGGDEAW